MGRLPPPDQRSYPILDSPAITHAPSLISLGVATGITHVARAWSWQCEKTPPGASGEARTVQAETRLAGSRR
jgi:hypothetical protein